MLVDRPRLQTGPGPLPPPPSSFSSTRLDLQLAGELGEDERSCLNGSSAQELAYDCCSFSSTRLFSGHCTPSPDSHVPEAGGGTLLVCTGHYCGVYNVGSMSLIGCGEEWCVGDVLLSAGHQPVSRRSLLALPIAYVLCLVVFLSVV